MSVAYCSADNQMVPAARLKVNNLVKQYTNGLINLNVTSEDINVAKAGPIESFLNRATGDAGLRIINLDDHTERLQGVVKGVVTTKVVVTTQGGVVTTPPF